MLMSEFAIPFADFLCEGIKDEEFEHLFCPGTISFNFFGEVSYKKPFSTEVNCDNVFEYLKKLRDSRLSQAGCTIFLGATGSGKTTTIKEAVRRLESETGQDHEFRILMISLDELHDIDDDDAERASKSEEDSVWRIFLRHIHKHARRAVNREQEIGEFCD